MISADRVFRGSGRRAAVFACILCACAAVLPGGVTPACAGDAALSEYAIKAAFLYKFLFFVTWPDSELMETGKAPLVLGIVGKDPFGDAFAGIENKPCAPSNRVLNIRRFGDARALQNLEDCQLVFICTSDRTERQRRLAQLAGRPILTISEHSGFLEEGGMVNLVIQDRKVRWEINQMAIRKAGLRMQAQLLRNAVRVIDDSGEKP